MKTIYYYALLFVSSFLFSQNQNNGLLKDAYLSVEPQYRSYGRDDHFGVGGGGVEISKDIKKWYGLGVNASYFQHRKKNWDFTDSFTGKHYRYDGEIKDFKISPFIQLFPINTKWVDFYGQVGFYTGYFHQKHYTGGYHKDYDNEEMVIFVKDEGYKGFHFGIEYGFGLRFQINRFFITPNIMKTHSFSYKDGFNALNIKVGLTL